MRHIASCSFGKDSLAMLLRLIEERYPLDEVVFYDTGKEFQAIYDTRDKIVPLLQKQNIKFTELRPKESFDYCMFEKPVKERNSNKIHFGYSWCGGPCRWGTRKKTETIEKYCNGSIEYIGIAHDETRRLQKKRAATKIHPLNEWQMTEADCLQYCYDRGFYWEEDGVRLYDILDRVSCWCCANKNLKELKNIYIYMPKYWMKLRDMQTKLHRPMKGVGKSIFDLEKRFEYEKVFD